MIERTYWVVALPVEGMPALFVTGCNGDQNDIRMDKDPERATRWIDRARAEEMAERLGDGFIAAEVHEASRV